jgi:outer membrane protein TolC
LESLSLGDRSVVASAWYDLNEAKASYVSAKSALTANEENYRLAAERYAVGVGTSLDVSAAQQTLTTARSQEVEARYGIQIDIAKLYRQVGVLNLELLLGAKPVPSVQDSPAIPQPIPKALKTPPAAGGVHP